MNLKEMKEQRNALYGEVEEIRNSVESEKRGLSYEEVSSMTEKISQIEKLDADIKAAENKRSGGVMEHMETRDQEQLAQEYRGLEQFLRKQDGEELRALATTSEGTPVIPENVANDIILKMTEESPFFEQATKFPSQSGSLKIAQENAHTAAGFFGEGEDVAEDSLDLSQVELTQKRVGAAQSVSKQLINDSAIDIVGYIFEKLGRKNAKAVERSGLVGTGGTEFMGIVNAPGVQSVSYSDAITIDTLMDLYTGLHPEFLDGAAFYMSRAFFNEVAKLKDNNAHYYLQNGVVNGKPTYTLLNAPVYVSDALGEENPAVFANVADAYAIMWKSNGFAINRVNADSRQALRGSELIVMDGYLDGNVYNSQAAVKLAFDAGATT